MTVSVGAHSEDDILTKAIKPRPGVGQNRRKRERENEKNQDISANIYSHT